MLNLAGVRTTHSKANYHLLEERAGPNIHAGDGPCAQPSRTAPVNDLLLHGSDQTSLWGEAGFGSGGIQKIWVQGFVGTGSSTSRGSSISATTNCWFGQMRGCWPGQCHEMRAQECGFHSVEEHGISFAKNWPSSKKDGEGQGAFSGSFSRFPLSFPGVMESVPRELTSQGSERIVHRSERQGTFSLS